MTVSARNFLIRRQGGGAKEAEGGPNGQRGTPLAYWGVGRGRRKTQRSGPGTTSVALLKEK